MHARVILHVVSVLVLLLGCNVPTRAAEPFHFPEGRHGKGKLRYIDGVPVLSVQGTPEEIGRQVGMLALRPAGALVNHFREFLKRRGFDKIAPLLDASSEALFRRFPAPYRREIEAMIQAAGADRNLIVLGNTAFDLQKIVGCSGLLVSAERSATGGPLYGRNFDFPFDDVVAEYSLVIVYRPEGKKAFAMVTFPGLLASNCGMNEDGLVLGANTVQRTADGSPPFDPAGVPYAVAAREVMENCGSLDDFDRWIRGHARTGMGILLACDPKRQLVYEITTKHIDVRRPDAGLLCATNHFRLPPMAIETTCNRYDALDKCREIERLDVADVTRLLDKANQGKRTIQTMVFEPSKLVLHLSLGRGPTSARPLHTLDLKPLLTGGETVEVRR
jgi:isopenicillin-N N-acyltransferase like protein